MLELVMAGCVLVGAVATGLVAHELAHAFVLRLFGVDYSISYFPGGSGVLGRLSSCPWAVVRPNPTGREPSWTLRVAALAPALLAAPPFVAGVVGPGVDSSIATAAIIGWLACSIPSPQDFSVALYAREALEDETADASDEFRSRAD
ncbi:hypothetical protein [Natronobacterium gregoryi]|uniref:Zincin peptidase n=2 Tax=Natronobacterium gregoryi TaxID=44930 RepID=L0AKN8_NATGS|nr:hypothetical protein [Natronobacterium gregoryi]AFZ74019.1 hypothetical protein Natgr_2878 [Natronobacterium gregoryi SP2]ELY70591.1 hypothetical protein C490_06439 [Natronobacterium gregoryi SP2]PLK20768.1 hypothetical protein CYV19_07580 [Natronobacterium gregoryi SP2]SFJ07567.1 hypothetical protein SAMN05443661_11363 [Natronobacterium gregoryi]